MRLTVLVDNNTLTDRYFLGEPALSFFVEETGARVLFDVGYSDAFLHNAYRMNIDLRNLDFLVLSHGHLDHTWGLDALVRLCTESTIERIPFRRPALVAHPLALTTKTVADFPEIGTLLSHEKLARHFDMRLTTEPAWLTDKLVFLGRIERTNDFEALEPLGKVVTEQGEANDFLADDSALAYKSPKGLVLIVGCSHAGICNIAEHAKKVCGEGRIIDIVGGLHLLGPPKKQLTQTLAYIKALKLRALHACHCTDLRSKIALAAVANLEEVGVGIELEYE